jgi:hypothetical protein
MKAHLVLAMLLAGPALAAAEVWRWVDGSGRLHYSNRAERVPADAQVVRARLGYLAASPAPLPEGFLEPAAAPAARRPARGRGGGGAPCGGKGVYYCPRLSVPHVLTIIGRDQADQVKEVSLLDALGVPWRSGLCP